MSNYIVLSFICILVMTGCASSEIANRNAAVEIELKPFSEQNNQMDIDSLLSKVDSATFLIPDTIVSYYAEDACVVDDNIYILDKSGNILVFNLSTEEFVGCLNARGKGRGEYAKPTAVSSDDTCVYVLDLTGLSILAYDKDLRFRRKINVGLPCLDFIKTESGFLLYNLNANEETGRIVYVDNEGKMVESFLKMPVNHNQVLPTKHLFQRYDDAVCVIDPNSNDIYAFRKEKFEKIASLVITNGENNGVSPVGAYMVNDMIISQYWSKFVMTNIYDMSTGVSHSGLVKISRSLYGFMPMTQYGKCLFGLYPDMTEGKAYHLYQYHFKGRSIEPL